MKKNLSNLQKLIKIKFKNLNLLQNSLTHKSYDVNNNYEKLEFLGDRVLGLVISKKLISLYPEEKEGILDKKLASLVNKNVCCYIGKKLKLYDFILMGNLNNKNIKIENKIISDCCEALIGAIYLEKDFDITEKFILKTWDELIKSSKITHVDAKTKLQEYSLKKYKTLPTYKLISSIGPKHKPSFKIAVKLKNSKFIEAVGSSKKNAEQAAAKEFLKLLVKS
tara:strand:- start:448 stop:1116 length:669 start_codon:yes stop_codon:yes gene_type:complete